MFKKFLYFTVALLMCAVALGAHADSEREIEGVASATPFISDGYYLVESNTRADYMTIEEFGISSPSAGKLKIVIQLSANETMQVFGADMIMIQHWNGSAWVNCWSTAEEYSYNTTGFYYTYSLSGGTSGDYYRLKANLTARKTWYSVDNRTVTSSYIPCK